MGRPTGMASAPSCANRISCRPDGRLGRAVHVPKLVAPNQERFGKRRLQSFAAAQDLQSRIALPTRGQQQLPGRGRRLHQSSADNDQGPATWQPDRPAAARYTPWRRHTRAAATPALQYQTRRSSPPAGHPAPEARLFPHRLKEIQQCAVADLHAFGPARGTGREDHVSQVMLPCCRRRLSGLHPLSVRIRLMVQAKRLFVRFRQPVQHVRYGNDRDRPRIFENAFDSPLG